MEKRGLHPLYFIGRITTNCNTWQSFLQITNYSSSFQEKYIGLSKRGERRDGFIERPHLEITFAPVISLACGDINPSIVKLNHEWLLSSLVQPSSIEIGIPLS